MRRTLMPWICRTQAALATLNGLWRRSVSRLGPALLLLGMGTGFLAADTPILTTTAGNTNYIVGAPAVVVDSGITVTGLTDVNGARVDISPFVAGDTLGYGALPGSVSASWNAISGVLTFSGTATTAEWQTLLRTVTFAPSGTSTPRTITFSLGVTIPYNGHFYEWVTDSNVAWTTARTNAAAKTLFGLQGYLVTVTSAGENAFCFSKLSGQGWMGATDETVEGTWRWVTGPEGLENAGAGRHFWTGDSTGGAVGGYYANWDTGEPNNCCTGENYAHFLVSGKWNDYANTTSVAGYVVEYGGMPGDPVLQISGTKTVDVQNGPLVTFQTDGTPGTSITGTNPQNPVYGGNCTAVTANTTPCWYFVNWTGTGGFVPTTANPLTVTGVTSDMVITANYSIYVYALAYAAGVNGYLTGTLLQTVNCGSSGTAVGAVGTGTYTFLSWSDGSTMNPRTDTNVTANLSVTATFATQEVEPNNNFTQPTAVSGPGLCVGRINPANDPDYYRIVLPHGSTLRATLVPPGGQRYYFYIYNQMGKVVAQSTTIGGVSNTAVTRNTSGATQYYYVVVRGLGGASSATPYQLTLNW